MREKKNDSLIIGAAIVVVAVLCLWGNEGRFDYYRAARQAAQISNPASADATQAVCYTGKLRECRIPGHYVEQFTGYYGVTVSAEIYCWERTRDDDGDVSWSKGWKPVLQSNDRNDGITKQLQSRRWSLPSYQLGELLVESAGLHFADEIEVIDPGSLQLSEAGLSLGLQREGDDVYLRKPGSVGELGDERLRFQGIPTQEMATYFGAISRAKGVGKQYDYTRSIVSGLIKDDGVLHHLVNGTRAQALKTVKSEIRELKWIVRLAGTAAIVFGLALVLGKFLHFIIAIPLLGTLASLGVWLCSITLGFTLSLLTIISSVVYHNPWTVLIAIGLLAGLVVGLLSLRNTARSNARKRLESSSGLGGSLIPGSGAAPEHSPWDNEEGLKKSYRNLVRLAMIDGKLEESENNYLVNWGRSTGLTDHAIVELFDQAKREHENGLEGTRFEDLYSLISLAMIDGYLSLKELNHIVHFGQQLGMSRAQVNAVVSKVRKGEYQSLVTV